MIFSYWTKSEKELSEMFLWLSKSLLDLSAW